MTITKFVSRLDLSEARVDRENSIIKGVRLCSLGEARGHNKYVDQRTLEQVRDCAKKYKTGLRVRFNPSTFAHGDGGLAGVIPADSIHVKDDATVGDLKVYKSFPHRDYLFEIAETAPDNFGLSLEFSGLPEKKDDKEYARCDEIFAATVVDLPAANPTGLFAADDKKSETREEKPMNKEEITKLVQDVLKETLPTILKTELQAFRVQQGTQSDGDITDDEKKAAGCTDDMTDEQKKAKVMEWRSKDGNTPVTKRDLFRFFAFAGGKPARASGEMTTDDKSSDSGEGGFERLVQKYRATGMHEGKAIRRAREDDGKGFTNWCERGRPEIKKL